jgi:pyruvate kinase
VATDTAEAMIARLVGHGANTMDVANAVGDALGRRGLAGA